MEPVSVQRKGKKREKYTCSHEPLEFPSCRVCGKKSTGIHFGVYSCEACKTFFRRSFLRSTPYKCDKGGDCLINAEKQNGSRPCPACRLVKCLDLGMSKDGVKQGRYTMTQRTSVILEVQKLRDQTSNRLATDPVNTHPGIQGDRQIKDGCELDCNIFHQDSQDDGTLSETSGGSYTIHSSSSSSNSPHIQDKEIVELAQEVGRTSIILGEESTKESGVPCLDKSEDILQRIMTGYGYLEHFTKSMTDEEIQDILDKEWMKHTDKTKLFGKLEYLPTDQYNDIYEKTQLDVDGRKKLLSEAKYEFMKMANDYVKFCKNIPFFSGLSLEDQKALLKCSHFEFFTILQHKGMNTEKEMCISYTGKVLPLSETCPYTSKETLLSWAEFSEEVSKLQLSPEEFALMLGICVTFRDRCQLDYPDDVENIQKRLLETLEFTLSKSHHENKGRRLAKLLDLFVRLRVIGDEYLELYKVICQDPIMRENLPEFLIYL